MYATALRNQGNEVVWDKQDNGSFDKVITSESQIYIPFLQLPHADRILTDAFNPKWQRNGNFKFHPGSYIQSASHCTWGRCTFCSEQGKVNEIRPVEDVIQEIEECKRLGFKEVFDDSATLPQGEWLNEFTSKFYRLNNGIRFSCNMRITKDVDFLTLHNVGFRMLLFGIESANQETLDRINKGVKVEDIIPTIKKASAYGLEPHIAVMFGFPWETDSDAIQTLKLVHYLLRKGYASTAQASFYTRPNERANEGHRKYIKQIYNVAYSPEFWFRQIRSIHNVDDLKYLWLKIKTGLQR
jgi:radical SAM superfamily enzyme YgiQ (UPF0313 family)